MSEYSSAGSLGYQRKYWIEKHPYDSSEVPWIQKLNEWLDKILMETFVESSYSDAINQNLYKEDFTRNAATVEYSLLRLIQYLGLRIHNSDEVVDYLLRYRGIYDATLFACIVTAETFGRNAEVSIEMYHDPEISDEYITIYVRQNKYDSDILDKIDSICREYEPALEGQNGWLLVTSDFRPPRG